MPREQAFFFIFFPTIENSLQNGSDTLFLYFWLLRMYRRNGGGGAGLIDFSAVISEFTWIFPFSFTSFPLLRIPGKKAIAEITFISFVFHAWTLFLVSPDFCILLNNRGGGGYASFLSGSSHRWSSEIEIPHDRRLDFGSRSTGNQAFNFFLFLLHVHTQ